MQGAVANGRAKFESQKISPEKPLRFKNLKKLKKERKKKLLRFKNRKKVKKRKKKEAAQV